MFTIYLRVKINVHEMNLWAEFPQYTGRRIKLNEFPKMRELSLLGSISY